MIATLYDLLDAAHQPIFVELDSGSLIYANPAGAALLASGEVRRPAPVADAASGAEWARVPGARTVSIVLAGEQCRLIVLAAKGVGPTVPEI